jgi:hypothetical protein
VVDLDGHDISLNLDQSKIFLIPNPAMNQIQCSWDAITEYELGNDNAIDLFVGKSARHAWLDKDQY